MGLNDYFDEIYLLNLKRRDDRLKITEKKLNDSSIDHIVFDAVDGSVMNAVWKSHHEKNIRFENSNYLACAISHLSIYNHAIQNEFDRILIIEDDVSILKNANEKFNSIRDQIPEKWDLLYLGFIPLTDDCLKWDYSIIDDRFISKNVFVAKNLWGLYAYGISMNEMVNVLKKYDENFSMELDRFYVDFVQSTGKSFGVLPQIFAASDDVFSDNSKRKESSMMKRSTDKRFSTEKDYL